MKRRLIEVIKGEKGQVLPVVLVLMLLGGLLIAPSLNYAATSLNVGQIVEKKVNGLYAADAGVEYALWYIVDGSKKLKDLKKLPENVNQLEVKIDAEEEKKGPYTIYYNELEETGKHSDYLDVGGEMGEWEEEEEAYPYTITVTWQPGAKGNIFLEEIGVRLPVGYEYKPGSAATFFEGELFSTDEPYFEEQDQAGAYMLGWEFEMGPPPHPEVTEEYPATQTFYVTGEGEQSGDYACVEAQDKDIGKVGEIVGELYTITAEAKVPGKGGEEIAIVEACVLKEEVEEEEEAVIYIISWQINP